MSGGGFPRERTGPLRVGVYCRVSTDKGDQANSLASQKAYFSDYIRRREGWVLAGLYPDEGASGTTAQRPQFQRMIRDAEAGRLDLILTKEVSRFARNTVDALAYTRRLQRLGVGVVFAGDNIDTRDSDGELRLTLMASMAQEESRKTSQRVKWGQRRRMEAGVVFGNNSLYGYDLTGGRLSIQEPEAQVVRRIYHKFLHEGKGAHVIARELSQEGVPPPRSASGKWSRATVRRILGNEKYAGDVLQKKYVTVDYLTHRKVENRGQEEQFLLRDHHPAVIDRPTWEATQAELARRAARQAAGGKHSARHWCSGKLRCGVCGSPFVPRTSRRADGTVYRLWGCRGRLQGDGCGAGMVNHRALNACVEFVLRRLGVDYDTLAQRIAREILQIRADRPQARERARLERRVAELERRRERVMDACFGGLISGDEMARMKGRYDRELEGLARQLQGLDGREDGPEEDGAALAQALRESAVCSEEVFAQAVEAVTVYDDHLAVKLRHLSAPFRLWYATSGAGERYTTTVLRWEGP